MNSTGIFPQLNLCYRATVFNQAKIKTGHLASEYCQMRTALKQPGSKSSILLLYWRLVVNKNKNILREMLSIYKHQQNSLILKEL